MARRIVIGFEETEQGKDALALGQALARALGATPLVATVLPWPGDLAGMADVQSAMEAEAGKGLADAVAEMDALGAGAATLVNPSASKGLYTIAHENDALLIVIGSSHRSAVGRVLAGSVGRSLLHGSPCGVAVAPRGYAADPASEFAHLAVAYDGSDEAEAALRTAIELGRLCAARLTVLTVSEPERYGLGTALAILAEADFHSVEREARERVLAQGLEAIPEGIEKDGHVLAGPAGQAIADASTDCDLLLVGSRGYGPIRQALLGSTAGAVIGSAVCPVVVLPRGAGVEPLGLGETGSG